MAQVAQKGSGVTIFGYLEMNSGHCPGQLALGGPA